MAASPLTARDRGFALVGRINRWVVAGAIAASGGLAIVAENAFHGHTRGRASGAATANAGITHHSSAGGNAPSGNGGDGASGSGGGASTSGSSALQPPVQAPAPATAPPSGGVVSGGS